MQKNLKRKRKNILQPNEESYEGKLSTLLKTDIVKSLNKETFSSFLYKNHSFIRSFEGIYYDLLNNNYMIEINNVNEINLSNIENKNSFSESFTKDIKQKFFPKNVSLKCEKLKTITFKVKPLKGAVSALFKKGLIERKSSLPFFSEKLKISNSEANFHLNRIVSSIPKSQLNREQKDKNCSKTKTNLQRLPSSQKYVKTTLNKFFTKQRVRKDSNILNERILPKDLIRNISSKIEKIINENENPNFNIKHKSPSKKIPIKLLKTEFYKSKMSFNPCLDVKKIEPSTKRMKIDQVKSRNFNSNSNKNDNSQSSESRNLLCMTTKIKSNNYGFNIFNSIEGDKKFYKKTGNNQLEIIPEIKAMKFSNKLQNAATPNKKIEEKKMFSMEKSRNIIKSKLQDKEYQTSLGSYNINVNVNVNLNMVNNTDKTNEQNVINSNYNSEKIESENLFIISEKKENIKSKFYLNQENHSYSRNKSKLHEKITNLPLFLTTKNDKLCEKSLGKIIIHSKPLTSRNNNKKKLLPIVDETFKKSSNTLSRNKINTKTLFLFSERDDSKIVSTTINEINKTFSKKNFTEQFSILQNKTFTNNISPRFINSSNTLKTQTFTNNISPRFIKSSNTLKTQILSNNISPRFIKSSNTLKTQSKLNKNEIISNQHKSFKSKNEKIVDLAKDAKNLLINTKLPSGKLINHNTAPSKIKTQTKVEKDKTTNKTKIDLLKNKTITLKNKK